MDHFDFSSHEALLEYASGLGTHDPRTHSQPTYVVSPQHQHQQQQQHSHLHPRQSQQHSQPQHHLQPSVVQPHTQSQPDSNTWLPYQLDQSIMTRYEGEAMRDMRPQQQQQQQPQQQQHSASQSPHAPQHPSPHSIPSSRPGSNHANQPLALPTTGLDLDYSSMLPTNWQFQSQPQQHHHQQQQQQQRHLQPQQHAGQIQQPHQLQQIPVSLSADMHMNVFGGFGSLQPPIEFMPTSAAEAYNVTTGIDAAGFLSMAGPMDSMNLFQVADYQTDANSFALALNQVALTQHTLNQQALDISQSSLPGSSPTGTILEIQSVSDNEWSLVNYPNNRHSMDSLSGTVSNPSQNLHIRTNSDSSSSDGIHSCDLSGSYEEIPPWPLSSPHDFHGSEYLEAQYLQTHGLPIHCHAPHTSPASSVVVTTSAAGPATSRAAAASSFSTSPLSSGPTSPPLRRRKSPVEGGKTTKAVIKKTTNTNRKDVPSEKKVGRRRGPLRPDQRQQAHEIRKLRACLRCKFLKKTCDKGEPCGGCRPSHARLWQVPCTRLDIKDIGGFMKDWKADIDRHITFGFSVGNIKGFSSVERTLYITHGYGHYLPVSAREVYVNDDKCFSVDWVEESADGMYEFEMSTSKLSAGVEGVSMTLLSEYLDRHLDQNFESFIDSYFQGTKFLTEILKTAYRYYQKEKTPAIRKALRLVLAYNLTLHITLVEGLGNEEDASNVIDDTQSRFYGKIPAPVMINYQVKAALSSMWRELQKDILEELSSLYSSVYSGEKLKNWPTIFMLAAILLAVWEEMQFDSHYRVPDEKAVHQFCDDMESTPVGVIVGLFQAISTKLPGLQEWDTKKHHHLLNSNPNVCDALSEVREHVNKHETYLRERSSAKFDRDDFDCLSNKFLSRLVIRSH